MILLVLSEYRLEGLDWAGAGFESYPLRHIALIYLIK